METNLILKKIVLPFALFFAFGCSNPETGNDLDSEDEIDDPEVGGPCSYRHDTLPIVILQISPTGDSIFDIEARRCGLDPADTIYCDTLSYYVENGEYIKEEDLRRENLKESDTICFIEQHMVSGSCNPYITNFTLEKYKKK